MIIAEKLQKQWDNATPNDHYIFAKLMENEDICIGVLETFLQVKINRIEYLETEETFDKNYASKGIRVDVYVQDDKNSVYNVEMQRRNLHDLPKRSRYYQSLIDLNWLGSGANYKELCQSYVIFINNYDPFEQERCVYDFENREATDHNLKLNDGTRKLFFNTRGEDKEKIDPRLRKILDFFEDKFPEEISDDPLLQKMIDEFYRIKANKEMEMGYMTQRVYENDLKTIGYMDGYDVGYDSALEFAESKYSPIIEKKDAQLAEKKAQLAEKDSTIAENKAQLSEKDSTITEMSDEIAQLKAMLREALAQLNQK